MKRPTYTLTSLLKKVFRPGERSLPRSEINQRLQECLRANGYERDSEEVLAEVLAMEHRPVKTGHTEAIIELTYRPHQLYDQSYRFLKESRLPKTVDQIVPELRRQSQFSWNQIKRMIDFETDLRFVQYQGDSRWYLAEWAVVNDRVYEYVRQNEIKHIALRSLSYFLEMEVKISLKDEVFLPELDDRFVVEGEVITLNAFAQDQESGAAGNVTASAESTEAAGQAVFGPTEASAESTQVALELTASAELPQEAAKPDEETIEPIQTALELAETAAEIVEEAQSQPLPDETITAVEEVAATSIIHEPQPLEEEPLMNAVATQSVFGEVTELLNKAKELLESRNEQMSQEVVGYFQQNNMQAIEVLMKEKHKNEQLVLGLTQVLNTANEQ